jgi:hypothetical protein
MAKKFSWDQAKRRQNRIWFGEIERKLAKLSKTTLTYRSSSYFMFYPLFTSVMVAGAATQEIQLWLYQDGLRQQNGGERCPLAAGCGLTLLNPEWLPIPPPSPPRFNIPLMHKI